MITKDKSNIITAHLDVTVTGEFFDDKASEETVRCYVEEELKELWSDVEVRLCKNDKPTKVEIHRKDCMWWIPGLMYKGWNLYIPSHCKRNGAGRSSNDSCPDAEMDFTIRELV